MESTLRWVCAWCVEERSLEVAGAALPATHGICERCLRAEVVAGRGVGMERYRSLRRARSVARYPEAIKIRNMPNTRAN